MFKHSSIKVTDFTSLIRQEFTENPIFAADIIQSTIRIHKDIEVDPYTHDVSTPINDILGWNYTRFTQQAKSNQIGAFFIQETIQETEEYWQGKIFTEQGKVFTENLSNKDKKDKKDKTGQYLAPKGIGNKAWLPPMPKRIVAAIAKEYELELPAEDELFWDWIKRHKQIPIVITEGGKKSLASFSSGVVTVALFGCKCGLDKGFDAKGKPIKNTLTPELIELCGKGRKVIIALDEDTKKKAKDAVFTGRTRLGFAIAKAGGLPYICSWNPYLGKGIDDLIEKNGEAKYKEILAASLPFKSWRQKQVRGLDSLVNCKIDDQEKYLPEINIPEHTQLIGIKAPKGSGKTHLLAEITHNNMRQGIRTLVITHRIQLTKELCQTLGLKSVYENSIKGDMTDGIFGYGMVINSLYPESNL
jgi:hypothetical protein